MSSESITIILQTSYENIHLFSDLVEVFASSKISFKEKDLKDKFLAELKVLCYELFSNSIKHTECKEIKTNLKLNSTSMIIEVISKGKGFSVSSFENKSIFYLPPYPENIFNKKFLIHKGDDYEVYCNIIDSLSLSFELNYTENKTIERMAVPEHFGLYLMTCLAKNVVYSRNENGYDFFKLEKDFN